ncbi:glycosyltransferase family 39 protein [Planctomonas psychrotolerans]|uniref:glycosyltransferase family 39 protein n=1 Tax=Planctomonas psychrotolerans TaxID=2528712 RepID=UPI00123BB0BA|nr:glycosyltransferase family 39 protein [Planctomonas psychrotolerans]
MADGGLTASPSSPRERGSTLRTRWARLPWWARVLTIYAGARAVTTAMILSFAARQQANPWTDAAPGYAEYATIWDGNWYQIVAVVGYPSELPRTESGQVAENAWAFMPVYPAVVRALMIVSGAGWDISALMVSIACGVGAVLMFYRLMRLVLDESAATFAVLLFSVAPVSPLLQLSYAESMQALLLGVALYLLLRRRYGWLLPVIAVMSLTRPTGLAFALALGIHVLVRFGARRRDPFPRREAVLATTAAGFSGVMGLSWPAIAWAVTGSPTAYTDTELAWRSAYIGYTELIPFTPWFQGATWWLGDPTGPIVVCLLVLAFAGVLFLPAVRRLGTDLRIWLAGYGLYLLAVFFPQSSTFRLLLPMFPLLGAVAQPRSWLYRTSVVALSLLGQWAWLWACWQVDGIDWTPP